MTRLLRALAVRSGSTALAWYSLIFLRFLRVEFLLRRRPLPAAARTLRVALGQEADPSPTPGRDWYRIQRLLRRSTRISERWPAGDTCLRRAMVLASFVPDARVVIGVRHGAEQELLAHAWVEVDGISLDPSAALYVVMPT